MKSEGETKEHRSFATLRRTEGGISKVSRKILFFFSEEEKDLRRGQWQGKRRRKKKGGEKGREREKKPNCGYWFARFVFSEKRFLSSLQKSNQYEEPKPFFSFFCFGFLILLLCKQSINPSIIGRVQDFHGGVRVTFASFHDFVMSILKRSLQILQCLDIRCTEHYMYGKITIIYILLLKKQAFLQ